MGAKVYDKDGKQVPTIDPSYMGNKMKTADEKQPNLVKPDNSKEPRATDYGRTSK